MLEKALADGLEHDEKGIPSARQSDHQVQLDKRRHKLANFDFGTDWGEVSGSGATALIGFGSSAAAMAETAALLADQGMTTRIVSLRLLAPLQTGALSAALEGCDRVVVVEQNHGRQLFHYLKGQMDFTQPAYSYAVPGPVPLGAEDIARHVTEIIQP